MVLSAISSVLLSTISWLLLEQIDELTGTVSEKSKFAGETISSGSKSRSKSNGEDGGEDSGGDGGAKHDDSNDCEVVKQFGTECIIWNRNKM